MALTNAERQARYRQRIRTRADAGCVTADDVRRVSRIVFDASAPTDPPEPSWEVFLGSLKGKRGLETWRGLMDGLRPDAIADGDFGSETDLVRRVAAVLEAAHYPPPAE